MKRTFIHTYVSVDCVVFGFDNNQLNILLIQFDRETVQNNYLKLPGSLIYDHEDVDDAAKRILFELTGIRRMNLRQYRCFASPDRARHPADMMWLDKAYQPNINRLITVAYLSLCKIDQKLKNISSFKSAQWCRLSELPMLPFDHNQIIEEARVEIQRWVDHDPAIIFELLPSKFTISQLHALYEAIYSKKIDVRNFHKKIRSMNYIVPLDEKQTNVRHRAARYYKLDKVMYKKRMGI